MYHETLGLQSSDSTADKAGWLTHLAIAAMVGISVGDHVGKPIFWLSASFIFLALGTWACWKKRPIFVCRVFLLISAACGFANWYQVHHRYLLADDIRQYAASESQLAKITGTIVSPIHMSTPRRGRLGQFSYQSPATLFVMACDQITQHGINKSASGKILVKVKQVDPSLQIGDRFQITGWLRKTQGPSNPGEYDYQKMLARQDVFTRITLPNVLNMVRLESLGGINGFRRLRAFLAKRANHALSIGMDLNSRELGLLQIMLLGQRGGNLDDLDTAFRTVGLAHLLSISGAHLGILLFLTLLVAKIFTQYPHRAIMVVVAVLIFYLIVVPTRVPIARAGVMAGAFCFCSLAGITLGRINILGLATLVILLWRPADLFTPGFQLSFGTVGGLVIYTPLVSRFLVPKPRVQLIERFRHRLARRIADYIAVNIVACGFALPMVAYHYQMISPWNMLLTMMALPMVTMMLGVGFLKIMFGMLFPSIALLLTGLSTWATQSLASLVENAATWPLANLGLGAGPSVGWMLGALLVIASLFGGMFAKRRQTFILCLGICTLWLVIPILPVYRLIPLTTMIPSTPIATLHGISVGNGSCFVLQLKPNKRFERDLVVMFDCGSQQFMDMGKRTVVPVLNNLNIRQIDYLILSHADIDHYSGTLDVADKIVIKKILLPQHLVDDAKANPLKATAKLLFELEQRQIPIQITQAGWKLKFESHDLQMIWPPPLEQFPTIRHNDSSLVLSVKTAGRRILLNGDIQQRAITRMLEQGMDLQAHITDLAHHGSIVKATPDWLRAVNPTYAIQSAGVSKLYRDKWPALLKDIHLPLRRLVTARQGMISIHIGSNGSVWFETFKSEE